MIKNAPTKRIEQNIENGMELRLSNGVLLCACVLYGYYYESVDYDDDNQPHKQIAYKADCYMITSHEGLMPAFYTEEYDDIQTLANVMRNYGDLRKWRVMPSV